MGDVEGAYSMADPLLDAKTTKLYQDAELLGICGHFDAWPKNPGPGNILFSH
jgi:hypothetical protein